jgi:serine/threonine protein kinase
MHKIKYKATDNSFDKFILNIEDSFFNKDNITLFDKRNIIKIIVFNNKKYAVKSFKIPHNLNKIVYRFFRDSKAKRSYGNSLKLQELNINTPKPIGYVEFNSLFLFKKSFYISEFLDYDFEIRAVFNDLEFKDRKDILKQFIEFTYKLHQKGIYHIDYSPGNILVQKDNLEYKFYLIDVNRMKFIDFDIDLRAKSISKLTTNIDDNKFIIDYYSQISTLDKNIISKKYSFYLNKEKQYLENKKRLKRLI